MTKSTYKIILGSLFTLFLAALLRAGEMAGGLHRITRDEINAGGEILQSAGWVLTGSVGGLDTALLNAPASYTVAAGLQGVYYYPDTIVASAPTPHATAPDILNVGWTAPRGVVPAKDLGVASNYQPASSYVVKYTALAPIATQAAFNAASTAAGAPVPATPGTAQNLAINSLSANTSYFISIEALDNETVAGRNQGYFSSAVSTWTLCNVPGPLNFGSFSPNSIQLRWTTNNNRPGFVVTYDAQVVTDTNTLANLQTRQTATAATPLAALTFTSLSQGVDYSFRVLARNGVNMPSPYSVWITTRIPVGLPFAEPFTGHDVDRFTANWLPNDGVTRPPWSPLDPSFQSEADDDPAFNAAASQPAAPAQTLSGTYTGLQPNTTYYARVRAFPVGGGQPSAHADLGSTMTGVHASQSGTYDLFVDSASFTWTAPVAPNGPNAYFYEVRMATSSDFGGTLITQRVPTSDAAQTLVMDITAGILSNTRYYARLYTLNGEGRPSAQPYVNLGSHVSQPRTPGVGVNDITFVDDYRIGVQWNHNGNNPVSTRYRLQVSTAASFGLVSLTTETAPGATSFTLGAPLQLFANTLYHARILTIGDGGVDSLPVVFGSTQTRPTAATQLAFSGMSPTAVTAGWSNVNAPNAQNNLNNGTTYRVEVRDVQNEASADQSGTTTALSRTFNSGLLANTTYFFRVYTQSTGAVWPDAGPLAGSTVTLTLPAGGPAGFTTVTSTGLNVFWGNGGNPSPTRFRVDLSSDPTFGFISNTAQGPDLLSQSFTGLLANTTYYARVWGVNHLGSVSASAVTIGSTVTLVTTPLFQGFQVHSSSITLLIDAQGNSPSTQYRVRDLNAPTQNYLTTLQAADATHPWPYHIVSGLPVNTLRDFRVSALNLTGSETPSFSASTWTLASPDAALGIGANAPNFLDITLTPGSNPVGGPRTQFAIRLLGVSPDGFPTLTGRYLGTDMDAGQPVTQHRILPDSLTPVWRNMSEWNNGILISTGLATGRLYTYQVYARNGDNGTGPNIVTVAGQASGQTKSGEPVMYLNGVSAGLSNTIVPANWVWTNTTDIPFIALGAFNNNIQVKSCTAFPADCQNNDITVPNHANSGAPGPFPGWNGRYDPAFPVHNAIPAPIQNYTSPYGGIRVNAQGRYYVHIVGDSYPYIPVGQGGDFTGGHNTDSYRGNSYLIFVDTTTPVAADMNLRAQRGVSNPTPIFSGATTGVVTPYFLWDDPDPTAPNAPNFDISPMRGYSWSFSTNAADQPVQSTDTFVNPNFIAGTATRAVDHTQLAIDTNNPGTYYFKVRAVDSAGNWSTVASFTYVLDPDLIPPTVEVIFQSSVFLPQGDVAVAVSTTGLITLRFSEPMDPSTINNTNIQIFRRVNNTGGGVSGTVPLSITSSGDFLVGSTEAYITPATAFQPGYRYEIVTQPGLVDFLGGNALDVQLSARFVTLMDPAQPNVMVCEALNGNGDPVTRISFQPNTWNGGYAGLAINEDPTNLPMAAPTISGLIAKANKSHDANSRGYGKPISVQEFNLYDAQALRLAGQFNQPATIEMRFNDVNPRNGYVDETENTPNPIRVSALGIYSLNEDTGVWSRLPSSAIDDANGIVRARLYHFSVYALMGNPESNLANAFAYPVPYKPSVHTGGIVFASLSSFGTIKIFTVNGDLVKTLPFQDSNGGTISWNPVTNDAGEPLASDVYVYLIESDQQKKTGKILVVR